MRPLKLRMRNWCQHQEKEFVLADGMNSIVGPNGSGKSNILDALLMALGQESNNCKSKTDRKTDNISHGEDRARIELEFEHQDRQGSITVDLKRNYRSDYDVLQREIAFAKEMAARQVEDPSIELDDEVLNLVGFKPRETVSAKLVWGDVQLRNTREVQEWMLSVTKMQAKALKESYFPQQGNVDAVIAGSGEERYRALSEQAGVTLCARIHKLLGDEISAQPDFGGVDADMREKEVRLAKAEGDFSRAESEHQKWGTKEIDTDSIRDTLAAYGVAAKAQESLAEARERVVNARQAVTDLKPELEELLEEGKTLRQETDAQALAADAARDLLTQASVAQDQARQLSELDERLKAYQEQLDSLQQPGSEPEGNPEAMQAEISHLAVEKGQKLEWIDLFESGECPTCGQPVADAQQTIAEYRERVAQIEVSTKELHSAIDNYRTAHRAWHQASTEYNHQSTDLKSRMAADGGRAAHLKESMGSPPTEEELADANKLIADHVLKLDRLKQVRDQYNAKVSLHDRAEGEVRTAEALVAANEAQLEGSPTAEQAKEASDALAQAQLDQQAKREAAEEFRVKRAMLEQAQEDHDRVKARFDLAQPTREWVGLLGKVRDLYHRNALPREAVLWYANQLIEHANEYLSVFESSFQMTMTEDMTFLAVFGDKVQPSPRLSGGEKNMLSISIRLAMADLFPSDLRLLILDEVEVHLDQENVARLPIVLERVKGLARNRGLTVLFVSHHPSLSDVSDHVISAA